MEMIEMVRAAVREELERWAAPEGPAVLQPKRAAKELDISLTKLKGLIRQGAIQTIILGKRRMVPRREIQRLASAFEKTRSSPRAQPRGRVAKQGAKTEAEKIRAAVRKPRKR